MSKKATIQELERRKDELLEALNLPARLRAGDAPEGLTVSGSETLATSLEALAASSNTFGQEPELAEFFSDFVERSEEGLRRCLEADLALLERARATGQEQVERAVFGTLQAVFPVRYRDETVHVLVLGRLRETPFTEKELADLAGVSGQAPDTVRAATATIPLLSPGHVAGILDLFRALRSAMEAHLAGLARTASLNHQLLQSERIRSLGALSGGVAHHFNNLLSVILGYSSFVLNREDHSKAASEALHKITEAAQRGRRLTEEILAFAGSDADEEAPCHVHETLINVLSLMEAEISSNVRIEKDLAAPEDMVLSPPSAVHQIVFNLVTNGLDSMPAGGVLTVSTQNTTLATEKGTTATFLQLAITDSSGLLPEGFAVGDTSTLPEDLGAGDRSSLRMSNVYGMIGRMDGTITVTSEPGSLTRVEVLLPVASERAAGSEEKKVRRRLAPSSIWVVDDDAIFREMCHQVLAEEGHDLVEFTGGKQLHAAWGKRDEEPNLIIMDFSMPEYNGLELCEWLRDNGSRVPVILVSGFSPKQPDIKKALKMRKTYFLQKPFTSRDLTDAVIVAMGETLIGE